MVRRAFKSKIHVSLSLFGFFLVWIYSARINDLHLHCLAFWFLYLLGVLLLTVLLFYKQKSSGSFLLFLALTKLSSCFLRIEGFERSWYLSVKIVLRSQVPPNLQQAVESKIFTQVSVWKLSLTLSTSCQIGTLLFSGNLRTQTRIAKNVLAGQLLWVFHKNVPTNRTFEFLVHQLKAASWYFNGHHLLSLVVLRLRSLSMHKARPLL